MTKNVLLLNPPGTSLYIRDYYCSKISKAHYMPQPVDLLLQSGFFPAPQFRVSVVDAIVSSLSVEQALERTVTLDPDLIITLFGAVSFEEDRSFLAQVRQRLPKAVLLASGDLFQEAPVDCLNQHTWLDGIITNFFVSGPASLMAGNWEEIEGLVYRRNGQIIDASAVRERKVVQTPVPQHHLFLNQPYRYPFADRYPMATVLTNYACPYPCTFCIMSQLGFKSRSAESVIAELARLRELGVRYLYFSDQTFYALAQHTDPVLDWMIENRPGFRWCCFSRVDRLDEAKMVKMKKAGCNVVMFGVEWAEDALNEKYRKGYRLRQVRNTFKLARKVGLRTMGTFLIGLPGQSEASIRKTIDLALELGTDYASFNVAVPRVRTAFREEALGQGLIDADHVTMDQSGDLPGMGTGLLTPDDVARLKKEAYRRFYFRPAYLGRRLAGIRTLGELATHLREASYLLKRLVA